MARRFIRKSFWKSLKMTEFHLLDKHFWTLCTYGIDSGNNYKYVADYHNNAITPSKIIQSPFNDGKQKIQFSGNNKLVVLSPGGPNQNSGQTHFIREFKKNI